MIKGLTDRQQNILRYIGEYSRDYGYPPTVREIGKEVGISSTSMVDYNLRIMEQKGYIRRDQRTSRGIEIVEQSDRHLRERFVRVPVMGRIAAGEPIPVPGNEGWADSPEEVLDLTRQVVPDEEGIYALRVKGTSMIDALIDDGDIVLLRPQRTAENGELVAAWLPERNETTLKQFYLEGAQVRLQPCNPQMGPLIFPADKVEIHGKVVGVIRRMGRA